VTLAPTLLAVLAHPDDESFVCGGTLARYAAAGVRVVLVCATRGEAGPIAAPALATRETLPTVREAELRAAAAILGIADVHLLDYPDGALLDVPFPEGVERVEGVLGEVRPAVVLTFGPEGVSGHPDHVAVQRWAKEAVYRARAERRDGWAPSRLYYCRPPRSWYRAVAERCRARGVPDWYGPRVEVLGAPDELTTTRIATAAQAATKLAAVRAHATQLPAEHPYRTLPDADLLELLTAEWFTRAWPPLPLRASLEADLFAADGA
jgi:LmbE family N-acetylglucosaminyl deacetylase